MSKIDDIEAYIINLESRKDRLEKSLKQAKNLGIEYRVIQAVDKYSIPADKLDFLAPEVVANWESHMKVYREFLKSDKKFALVLEDDFTLSHKFNHKFFTNQKIFYFDFVQIGYLKMIWADHIAIRFQNSRDLLFKILNYFSLKFQIKFLRSKLLIREQANIPFKFVLNDIRAGSHAQIVSRNFAKNMLLNGYDCVFINPMIGNEALHLKLVNLTVCPSHPSNQPNTH